MKTTSLSLALSLLVAGPALAQTGPSEPAPKATGTEAHPPAEEEEEEEAGFSYTIEAALASSYVFRGDRLSSSQFEPVLQPYIDLGYAGAGPGAIAFGVWMNKALTNSGEDTPLEFDIYASYTFPITVVEFKLGYIVYLYPDADTDAGEKVDSSHEFSLAMSYDLGLPVAPYLGVHVDPIRLKGFYAHAGVAHEVTVSNIDISSSLNLGVSDYEGIDFKFQDLTLSSRGQMAIGGSGLYAALTGALALSGRAEEDKVSVYAILSLGFSR